MKKGDKQVYQTELKTKNQQFKHYKKKSIH